MTDLILQSNNTSVVLRSLADAESADLSYSMAPSYPLLAKQTLELASNQSVSGAPAGQEVHFNLNKSMLWRNAQIKTVYTVAATTNEIATPAYGLTIFESVQLRSNNKVIATNTDGYILARAQHGSVSQCVSAYRRALPLNSTTFKCSTVASDTTKCVFTPLYFSFFEHVKNHLDLGFYEQQTIVAKFATTAKAGLVAAMTGATCTLLVDVYVPDMKFYDSLRAENQQPSKPLNMLTTSSFQEVQTLTSATTTTIKLNVNYPVVNTYFYIRCASGSTPATYSPADAWVQPYNTFSFSVGGITLLSSLDCLTGNWESDRSGSANGIVPLGATGIHPTTVTKLSNTVTKLCWGLSPMNHTDITGALSFNSVNSPQLTVNYTSNASFADFELVVVHEYFQIATMDASNSSINVTANN